MAVSIRDVAARAGVSVGTVSHVLNGNAAARIAPETQERVRRSARELGYRPNRVARTLGRGKTDTLGLLIGGLRNPFFVELLENVEADAQGSGYRIQLEVAPSLHGTFAGNVLPEGYWPVDGILMWSIFDQALQELMGRPYAGLPTVFMGTHYRDRTNWVTFDYYLGGRIAAERLLYRGCRRIGYVTPYAYGVDRHEEARHQGFVDACRERGVSLDMFLTRAEETREAGLAVAAEIAALPAQRRPEGIFCHNDMLAIGVCCGLRRAQIALPDEIAVVGFDGVEEGLYLEAPLTTVALPIRQLCRSSLDMLFQWMHAGHAPEQGVLLAPHLREGKTA